MTDPAGPLAYLREALADSDDAPLSVRRAMLVVMLVDALVDRSARRDRADPLRVRTAMTSDSPELDLVLELAAHRGGGPRLVVEAVEVPLTDFEALSVAEFMVSLYNSHSVPRLLVAMPDGGRRDARAMLHTAVRAADQAGGGDQPAPSARTGPNERFRGDNRVP